MVFGRVAVGNVVGAGQVVVGQRGKVENVVVAFFGTDGARGLVDRTSYIKVWPRENQVIPYTWKLSISSNGVIFFNGVCFIKHHRCIILAF